MQPALLDSSIYISALRRGDDAAVALRQLTKDAPLWLSAVVLEELYAGAGERDRHVVEQLEGELRQSETNTGAQSQRLDSGGQGACSTRCQVSLRTDRKGTTNE